MHTHALFSTSAGPTGVELDFCLLGMSNHKTLTWAELSANSANLNRDDFKDITALRKDREKRLKIINCIQQSLKATEHLICGQTLTNSNFGLSDTFINRMKGAIAEFERNFQDRLVLSDTLPPKGLLITIRMKEDLGTILTEHGQLILNKNCIISGNRSELIHLVKGGHAELLY